MRTEQRAPVQSTRNGKWSAVFVTYNGTPGSEYVANECQSAPLFDTEDAAYIAGHRALDELDLTGKYPNMCEAF